MNKDQQFMMSVAKLAAARSTGIRLKVGAVVTDADDNMVAFGYNGSVRGGDNNLEDKIYRKDDNAPWQLQVYPYVDETNTPYRLVTKDSTLHAEQNCIAHAARRGISINHGKMYLTHSPCLKCATMMIQSGISEVFFIEKHESHDKVQWELQKFLKITQMSV